MMCVGETIFSGTGSKAQVGADVLEKVLDFREESGEV